MTQHSLTPLTDMMKARHAARTPDPDPMKERITVANNAVFLEVARMMDGGTSAKDLLQFVTSVATSIIDSTCKNIADNGHGHGISEAELRALMLQNISHNLEHSKPFHAVKDEAFHTQAGRA